MGNYSKVQYYSSKKYMKEEYDSDEDSVFGSFNPNLNTKDKTSL